MLRRDMLPRAVLAGLCIASVACESAPARSPEPPPTVTRYLDEDGKPLHEYDALWGALARFYQSTKPPTIQVGYRHDGNSRFDVVSSSVSISLPSLRGRPPRATVAHESSHLFLAEVTAGKSALEPFRFLDEGLASVLEHEIGDAAPGAPETFERKALRRTAARLREAPLSFERVQHWSTYFGDGGPKSDWGAYDVGASFVFFVRAELGDARFLALLQTIATTPSLDAAVHQALGRPLAELEAGWLAYIRKVDVTHVVSMMPKTGARGVDPKITEIVVEFDAPMSTNICLLARCDEGICFDHAKWRSDRTLVVTIDHPLLARHVYELSLGGPRCRMVDIDDAELPVTDWTFETE